MGSNGKRRVVVTGLGIIAPNGVGTQEFKKNLKEGKSGIRNLPELKELGFRCTVGGQPEIDDSTLDKYLTKLQQRRIVAEGVRYGVIAGLMAWEDSGEVFPASSEYKPDTGVMLGAGMSGGDIYAAGVEKVNNRQVKRLGSVTCPNSMSSSSSAFLGGIIGAGNQVSTNASACASGTEAVYLGAQRIQLGLAERMICGACDSGSLYVRAGFDAMRVLNSKSNNAPEQASRPLSAEANGFVPGAGGGALVLESLESAEKRGAEIYAEILSAGVNSGGQRNGGSMTAPNPEAIVRLVTQTVQDAKINPTEIDIISGHLTATQFDVGEVRLWTKGLQRDGKNFPQIQALKSLTGHALSASGALELVALTLQLHEGFLHPNANCSPIHPDILEMIPESSISKKGIKMKLKTGITASFGFGDVNACLILKKWDKSF
ncbi:MAG: beta-ketoacyl-[acyl-carrier-protein] synthase family protein [Bacteroidetes bacterium]|jgi:3-oxoacyl-(acyl-carrier-protein) synthase|nr:beta-ketoacyl-[acyl-carrier-protein] synthase family protein [Bacteroidota bacterium]